MRTEEKKLTLYHLGWCPFCIRVRSAADALGVDLELVEISEQPEARSMLVQRRGRATVPVLGIPNDDGTESLLGESRDIVAYLHERYGAQGPEVSR